MPVVTLAGGIFDMGTPVEDTSRLQDEYHVFGAALFAPETPQHQVGLTPFEMDQYLVTKAHFYEFVSDAPDWLPSRLDAQAHNGRYLAHWISERPPEHLANHPVINVTWHAAMAYATWLGKRLPTEAEWEYVARAGPAGLTFPWGASAPNPTLANYAAARIGGTTPVGMYPSSAYGLFDLAGNVWEYCIDEWLDDYYAHSESADPIAGGRAVLSHWRDVVTRRVIRGGSWDGVAVNMRAAYRDSHPPTAAGPQVGFRCARWL